jgi:cytochrome c heme-lyase
MAIGYRDASTHLNSIIASIPDHSTALLSTNLTMGWFWSDSNPSNRAQRATERHGALSAPHPMRSAGATPAPACPMHKSDATSMPFPPQMSDSSPSSCPVKSPAQPARYPTEPETSPGPPRSFTSNSTLSKLNPLNYMPSLSNTREHNTQTTDLPLEREISTIPRGDADSNWEYPSPQQMYNAMLRKGYTDTPVDAVESMVAVHNFLNEGAWNEIVEWEGIFGNGLAEGWTMCAKGEQGMAMERARREYMKQRRRELGSTAPEDQDTQPKLLRFMGRPKEPTPKARILTLLGKIFPESYGSEPPFDRHDWYVARTTPSGTKEVRYVIDYYAAGVQETGEPVFYLDIRPALDTPSAAIERAMRWGGDVWHRASGVDARNKQ